MNINTKKLIYILASSSCIVITACTENRSIKNENEKKLETQLQAALNKVKYYETLTTQSIFNKMGDKAIEDKVTNNESIKSYYTYLRDNEGLASYLDMRLGALCPAK